MTRMKTKLAVPRFCYRSERNRIGQKNDLAFVTGLVMLTLIKRLYED